MKKSKSSNKMLEYFSGLKLRSFLAPFFKLLEAIFELLVPLVVSNIMDIGVKITIKITLLHTLFS